VQINKSALGRLTAGQFRPDAIGTIFETMALAAQQMGSAATEFTLGYQHPDDPVADGDLVPVIVLALRPAAMPAAMPET
jgi:hypothetical protein